MMDNRDRVDVLDSLVDCGMRGEMVDRIATWAANAESRYVCFSNVHSVITARDNLELHEAISKADMVAPDGAPIAWFMRQVGSSEQCRIPGPDLMLDVCERCAREGIPVGFFGSMPEVLDALVKNLSEAYPGLKITYTCSPPFRDLTDDEMATIAHQINEAGCAVLFVGLGCPKQEVWMLRNRGQIKSVMLGVGAAFDFHAGVVRRAPEWMRAAGLEWLHRLITQPGRLWKRYLTTNSRFLVLAAMAILDHALHGK